MSVLKIRRLNELPGVLETSTLYITKNTSSSVLVDLTFVGNNVSDVRRAPGLSDTTSVVNAAIAALTADDIPDLPGSKIISDISVNTTGNAATATRLQSAVTINGVEFDGSQAVTVSAVDTETPRVAASALGVTVATLVGGKVPVSQLPTGLDNIDTYPTVADFPAVGAADVIYIAEDTNRMYRWAGAGVGYVFIPSGAGQADEAFKLSVPREIALEGDATGSTMFDGSANVEINVVLANVGTAGTQSPVVTTDSKGRIISSRALLESDIPDISGSKVTSPVATATNATSADAVNLTTADW